MNVTELQSMKTSDLIIQSVLLLQHHRDPRTPMQLQALCDEIDARMPPRQQPASEGQTK